MKLKINHRKKNGEKNKYVETKQHATEEAPLKNHIKEEIRKQPETKEVRRRSQEICGTQRNSSNGIS